jgi:hypothetical protein
MTRPLLIFVVRSPESAQVGEMLFLYDFEFVPYQNPPHTKDRFAEDLRAYFTSNGLNYGMSALGGMVHCRGDVRGKSRPATEEDRQALAAWASRQRVRCTARLGVLELNREDIEFFRPVTEWVFAIDNLTDEDRAEAAAWHESIRQWVQSAQQRQA